MGSWVLLADLIILLFSFGKIHFNIRNNTDGFRVSLNLTSYFLHSYMQESQRPGEGTCLWIFEWQTFFKCLWILNVQKGVST